MEKQDSKYIEHIEIKGLWGRYDVNWKLNSDVNILVGENGTGKSTILKLTNLFLRWNPALPDGLILDKYDTGRVFEVNKKYKNLYIQFDNKKYIETSYNSDTNLQKVNKPTNLDINIDLINTFDSNPPEPNHNGKILYTPLEKELDKIMRDYLNYQLTKSNQFIASKISQKEAFGKKLFFIKTLNRLFKVTNKVVDSSENEIVFKTEDGYKINWLDLSSGEKQLLIILLTALCQDEKPSILLMDEPEISLDIAWQFELLSILRTLNPNCQLIIVTHSPAIYGKGWRDKVTFIEDIIPQLKKATV